MTFTQSSNSNANVNSFMQTTPMSGFADLPHLSTDNSVASSPRFMLDWSQMPLPMGYEGLAQPQMLMNPEIGFDPAALSLAPTPDGLLGMMDLNTSHAPNSNAMPLMTPTETPKVERQLSELALAGSNAGFPLPIQHQPSHNFAHHHPPRSHNPSISSSTRSFSVPNLNGEMAAIIAGQDAWSVFRCTPTMPSSSCPKTARANLERLERTLRNHEGWSSWSPQFDEAEQALGDNLAVMQLHESTRDKLLAITQSILHKALEIHRAEVGPHGAAGHGFNPYGYPQPQNGAVSNFVLLPPTRILEYLLRAYANCFERYFPLTSRGQLDVNELMHCYNDRAASLLVLMMIAQGAVNFPAPDARMLTGGLTEACRISLFDLIEKNIGMSGNPIVLHSALIFTVQAAWSGDKWQMDIAMGQRGMYFSMLRHSGVLDSRAPSSAPMPPHAGGANAGNNDHLWSEWIQNESRSRLVYSWVMVDQDMALFHDCAPLFAVTELATPMPDADRLWHATSAAEWTNIFEQVHEFSGGFSSVGSGARPLSLRELFRHFLDEELISLGIEMTPLQLRLLLHPIQSLMCQFSQLLSCFSHPLSTHNQNVSRRISAGSTRHRLEEVQSLLQRWFDLAERYLKANPMCPMMQTNLVIFHLISLNAVTDFPEIERMARREVAFVPGSTFEQQQQQFAWAHKRCITDVEEAVYHCGQVFRLVRSMSRSVRPPWWAGALYRVALVLWADSLVRRDVQQAQASTPGLFPVVPGPSFAIDALAPDHPLIIRYLTKREGVPCVTRRDGTQMPIDQPFPLLRHCIDVIDEGAATRFSDGIRSKLETLSRS